MNSGDKNLLQQPDKKAIDRRQVDGETSHIHVIEGMYALSIPGEGEIDEDEASLFD